MGHRLGLFSYATKTAGGHVDVDEFPLSDTLSSEAKALDRSQLDAAIAHAATLRASDYPADAWADLQSVLAKAKAVGQAGTQNQLDAPERALSYQLARLGTLKEASLDVTVAAATRCIAGKVVVTVRATNADDVPVALRMESAAGTKGVHDVYFSYSGPTGDLFELDTFAFTEGEAAPALEVAATAATRCIAGKAIITVQATNESEEAVSVTMTSPYGTKTVASVAAGTTVSHAFTTRQANLSAGAVTVGASAMIDGKAVSMEVSAPYAARPCS